MNTKRNLDGSFVGTLVSEEQKFYYADVNDTEHPEIFDLEQKMVDFALPPPSNAFGVLTESNEKKRFKFATISGGKEPKIYFYFSKDQCQSFSLPNEINEKGNLIFSQTTDPFYVAYTTKKGTIFIHQILENDEDIELLQFREIEGKFTIAEFIHDNRLITYSTEIAVYDINKKKALNTKKIGGISSIHPSPFDETIALLFIKDKKNCLEAWTLNINDFNSAPLMDGSEPVIINDANSILSWSPYGATFLCLSKSEETLYEFEMLPNYKWKINIKTKDGDADSQFEEEEEEVSDEYEEYDYDE